MTRKTPLGVHRRGLPRLLALLTAIAVPACDSWWSSSTGTHSNQSMSSEATVAPPPDLTSVGVPPEGEAGEATPTAAANCPPIALPAAWDHARPAACVAPEEFAPPLTPSFAKAAIDTCLALYGWCVSQPAATLPWRVRRALGDLAPLVRCVSPSHGVPRIPVLAPLPIPERLPDARMRELHRTCTRVASASAKPMRDAKGAAIAKFRSLTTEQATETLLRAVYGTMRGDAAGPANGKQPSAAGQSVPGDEYDYIRDTFEAPAEVRARTGAVALLVSKGVVRASTTPCDEFVTEAMAHVSSDLECELCGGEPFSEDPRAPGFACTAFFLDRRHLVTAGHCAAQLSSKSVCRMVDGAEYELPEQPMLDRAHLIRDFERDSDQPEDLRIARPIIPGDAIEVLGCEFIRPSSTQVERGNDWALLRVAEGFALPETFVGLELADATHEIPSTEVHMLSHFAGLTLKYTLPGVVDAIHGAYFEMQVDGYYGSSGAPVFDDGGRVVGLFTISKDPSYALCAAPPPGEAGCCCMEFCPGGCTTIPSASKIRPVRELYEIYKSQP